jgi:hypothetical protein
MQMTMIATEIEPEGLVSTRKNALHPKRMSAVPGPRLSNRTDPRIGAKDIIGHVGPIVDAAVAVAAAQVLIARASRAEMTVCRRLPKSPIADPVKIALAGA